jgi:hypothetical protein
MRGKEILNKESTVNSMLLDLLALIGIWGRRW